jgi:peptidoglycan/xylan/chitin deacetylase (PgdA/CDA1 family)
LGRLYFLYHELRVNRSQYSYVLETEVFRRHIDLFSAVTEKKDSALQPCVTFDDGHLSNFEYALPILQDRRMKAQFFITVGWTGRKSGYMGWQELQALQAAGQSIGAHGWSHKLLTHCNERELQTELVDSRKMLEDELGVPITTMSLPGGRYNRRVLASCQEAGYTQIYTSIPRGEPIPPGLTVGRLNIVSGMGLDWIADLFESDKSALPRLRRVYQVKALAQSLMGDRIYEKLWALLNHKEATADASEGTGE